MKQHTVCLLTGILIFAGFTVSALGAKPSANMTCEDFLALDEVYQPRVVYWTEGFSRNGRPEDAIIDFTGNDRLLPKLIEECTKNPKHLLSNKIKVASAKNTKQ